MRSWNALQRAAVWVFVIAVLVAVAFVGGRASVDSHRGSSVNAPASIPSASAGIADACRLPHGRC